MKMRFIECDPQDGTPLRVRYVNVAQVKHILLETYTNDPAHENDPVWAVFTFGDNTELRLFGRVENEGGGGQG